MKKLKASPLAKTIAVVLFCALCLGAAVSAAALGMLYTAGFYDRGADAAREELAQTLCSSELWNAAGRVFPENGAENAAPAVSGNYRYEVFDVNGTLRLSNYNGEETLASATQSCGEWYSYGAIRPGIVLFDEVPDMNNVMAAVKELHRADLILIAGTSMRVSSASKLFRGVRKAKLAILNNEPTAMDDRAELVIRGSLSSIFQELWPGED